MRPILTFVLAIWMSVQPWMAGGPAATGQTPGEPGVSIQLAVNSAAEPNIAAATSSFRFISWGDAQDSVTNLTNTANQAKALNPAFTIFNGDLENDGVVNDRMTAMTTAFGSLYNSTFLVRGNHDNHVSGSGPLWESFFETANRPLPAGVTNYVAIDPSSRYLTYSFDYGNSRFIGLDAPGDFGIVTSAEFTFLDARLTDAEALGLTHAFLFWHGPEYCVESVHCSTSTRTGSISSNMSKLVTIINKHPIVTATFHGHEHILGWVHMDNTRVSTLTRSYEEFITSPSGGYTYNSYLYPARMDYYYPTVPKQGFGAIDVNGSDFTFSIYVSGNTSPVWSKTFSKSGTPVNTPTSGPTSTFTRTATRTATRTPTAAGISTNTPTRTTTRTSVPTSKGTVVPGHYFVYIPMVEKNVHMPGVTPNPTRTRTSTATVRPSRTPTQVNTKTSTPTRTPTTNYTPTNTYTPRPSVTPGDGTRPLKYYMVDRVTSNADFAKLGGWGIDTAVVDFDINGKASTWQTKFEEAARYGINIVIWPSDYNNPRPNCGWEAPYPITANGDITKVKPLIDVASQYANFTGIVNAHESFWTCTNMTFDEMAGLKDQLKAYALSKGRQIKVWNYINGLYTTSKLPDDQIARIMDVGVIWKHCAGGAEGSCDTGKYSALAQMLSDRTRLTNAGLDGVVDLVYIMQTFTLGSQYATKFTLAELENYSCEFLDTSTLDGFGYYTWNAGWWPDLHSWPELHPAIPYIHDTCAQPAP